MKKDKILEAYEEMLSELYTITGRSVGISRSGSQGQRVSGVALVCPTCGDLDDHDHKHLKKGDSCPKCGHIVEETVYEATEVGDYWIPDYGLTGVLREAHFAYFKAIIKKFGKLSKTDDVFRLRKAWTESMKILSDEKNHNLITKKW